MDRKQFLHRISTTFKSFYKDEEQLQQWMNNIKDALPENTDYEELHKVFIRTYTDSFRPPTSGWLYQQYMDLRRGVQKKYIPPKDGVPPTPEFLELRKKFEERTELIKR